MVRKNPNAYRTISEAAQEVGVPAHVLRFWESRFSQIRPMKKGGGRRYYRPTDLALLSGIRALLYDDGLSIKNVQVQIKTQGVAAIAARARTVGAVSETDAPEASAPAVGNDDESSREESETHKRLSGALQKLLTAREQINTALQKH